MKEYKNPEIIMNPESITDVIMASGTEYGTEIDNGTFWN